MSMGAWIDYNHNGLYDPTEFINLTPYLSGYNGTFTGTVTIPARSLTGQTGMRIASSDYVAISNATPCGNIQYGEVADFVITINSASTYVSTLGNPEFSVKAFPNPVNNIVTIRTSGTPGNNQNVILTDITGRVIQKVSMDTYQTNLNMVNLDPGLYLIKYEDDMHTSVIKISKE
jgi:hypothetical protein